MYIYIIYVSEKVTGLSEAILLREAYTHTHTHTSEKVTGLSEAILLREAHGTERTKER